MAKTTPTAGQPNGDDELARRIRVEFAVNISNQDDLNKIENALKLKGVNLVSSDINDKMIQFDLPVDHERKMVTSENAHSLQKFIEQQTGFLAVLKGLGQLDAAVAELRPPQKPTYGHQEDSSKQHQVMGVVRLSQLDGSRCYADGSLDGLNVDAVASPARYLLAIHEFGDLAGNGYENIGNPIINIQETQSDSHADKSANGRLNFTSRLLENCDVSSMIGRSIALSEFINHKPGEDSSDIDQRKQVLSAGVIARASTIGSNKKQICSCSGKTLWEERVDNKVESQDNDR